MVVVRWCIVAASAATLLAGCGRSTTRAGATNGPTAAVDATKVGTLDVSWWMLPPTPATLTSPQTTPRVDLILGKYLSNDTGLPEEQIKVWRENGLRVVAIPTAELEAVRTSLGASGPIEQQTLAQSGNWKSAYKGPAWLAGTTLRLDNGPLELPPGALRAMVRSWLVPIVASPGAEGQAARSSAAMQFELAFQHQETRRPASEFQAALAIETPKTLSDEGLVFWRLELSGLLRAGRSYLIVPDEPSAEWKSSVIDRMVELGTLKTNQGAVAPAAAGPEFPLAPTLGEAILSDAARGRPDRRSILVLTPNVPDHFELLSDVAR